MFNTEFTGKIIYIGNSEFVGANQLEKKTIVIQEEGDKQYPASIQFDLMKEKVKMSDSLSVGDTITAHLNFKSNYSEKTDKYYQSINAWRIDTDKVAKVETTDDLPF